MKISNDQIGSLKKYLRKLFGSFLNKTESVYEKVIEEAVSEMKKSKSKVEHYRSLFPIFRKIINPQHLKIFFLEIVISFMDKKPVTAEKKNEKTIRICYTSDKSKHQVNVKYGEKDLSISCEIDDNELLSLWHPDNLFEYISKKVPDYNLTELVLTRFLSNKKRCVSIGKFISSRKTLELIDLSCNENLNEGIPMLFDCIKKNANMKYLMMSKCGINDDCNFDSIGDLMKNLKKLEFMDLSFNRIGVKGMKGIAVGLKNNKSLIKLDLSENEIGGTGKEMELLFKDLGVIQEIDLSGNRICDKGLHFIAKNIRKNEHLLKLLLCDNYISVNGIKVFAKALSENKTLLTLELSDNEGITSFGATQLILALKDNKTLLKLLLLDCQVELRDILSTLKKSDPIALVLVHSPVINGECSFIPEEAEETFNRKFLYGNSYKGGIQSFEYFQHMLLFYLCYIKEYESDHNKRLNFLFTKFDSSTGFGFQIKDNDDWNFSEEESIWNLDFDNENIRNLMDQGLNFGSNNGNWNFGNTNDDNEGFNFLSHGGSDEDVDVDEGGFEFNFDHNSDDNGDDDNNGGTNIDFGDSELSSFNDNNVNANENLYHLLSGGDSNDNEEVEPVELRSNNENGNGNSNAQIVNEIQIESVGDINNRTSLTINTENSPRGFVFNNDVINNQSNSLPKENEITKLNETNLQSREKALKIVTDINNANLNQSNELQKNVGAINNRPYLSLNTENSETGFVFNKDIINNQSNSLPNEKEITKLNETNLQSREKALKIVTNINNANLNQSNEEKQSNSTSHDIKNEKEQFEKPADITTYTFGAPDKDLKAIKKNFEGSFSRSGWSFDKQESIKSKDISNISFGTGKEYLEIVDVFKNIKNGFSFDNDPDMQVLDNSHPYKGVNFFTKVSNDLIKKGEDCEETPAWDINNEGQQRGFSMHYNGRNDLDTKGNNYNPIGYTELECTKYYQMPYKYAQTEYDYFSMTNPIERLEIPDIDDNNKIVKFTPTLMKSNTTSGDSVIHSISHMPRWKHFQVDGGASEDEVRWFTWYKRGKKGINTIPKDPITIPLVNKFKKRAFFMSSVGKHGLFITKNDQIFAFGDNFSFQLGTLFGHHLLVRENELINYPKRVQPFSKKVVYIACGQNHTLFLMRDNTVYGCGLNDYGELSLEDFDPRTAPVLLDKLTGTVVGIACGARHSIFILKNGSVKGCGCNSNGQIGLGKRFTKSRVTIAMQIGIKEHVVSASAGYEYSIFLTKKAEVFFCGKMRCWEGKNRAIIPQKINFKERITKISAAPWFFLCLSQSSRVYGMGQNKVNNKDHEINVFAPLKTKFDPWKPFLLNDLSGKEIIDVECGRHSCFFRSMNGTVFCMGKMSDWFGKEGKLFILKENVEQMEIGREQVFLWTKNNELWVCGENKYGGLALGNFVESKDKMVLNENVKNLKSMEIFYLGDKVFKMRKEKSFVDCFILF